MDGMPAMEFRGKRVTVVGLARSGVAACNVLADRGARVLGTDRLLARSCAGSGGLEAAVWDSQPRPSSGGLPERI